MELVKSKKRASRRKRNLVAKALLTDKQFRQKVVQPKGNKRKRISVREVDQLMENNND